MESHRKVFNIFAFVLIGLCLSLIESQLTNTDLQYIKQTLHKSQGENGYFGKSLENTYKAVYSLKALNESVENFPKICREIDYEARNKVDINILSLDKILGCRLNLPQPQQISEDSLNTEILEDLYAAVQLAEASGSNVDWLKLFENLKKFVNVENLFSPNLEKKVTSLTSTVQGLSLMTSIKNQLVNNTDIDELLINIIQATHKQYTLLREDLGLFSEEGVSTIRLNSEFAAALVNLRSLVNFENFDGLLAKILNYLLRFRYDYQSIDGCYQLIRGLSVLLK